MNEPQDDAVSVELPLAHSGTWMVVLRGIVGLAGIILFTYFFVIHGSVRDRWFNLACYLWVLVGVARFLWWANARQVLSVSETTLTITTSSLGLRRVRKYPSNRISYLRIQTSGLVGVPMLAFERENGTTYLGRKLKTKDPWHLLDNVYARFPQLRGMTSYFSMPNFSPEELDNPTR